MTTFADLGLPEVLSSSLAQRGITQAYPIQVATIPAALAGKDIRGKAPTGSGKTLAFGLPLVVNVQRAQPNRPKALILAPTRELAQQIHNELKPLARVLKKRIAAVHGGVGYGPQRASLRQGVDVLVATPGRLEDLIEQRTVNLNDTNLVVIDEADRMADMGFLPAVRRILNLTSSPRQTLLYSATLDADIAVLSREYQTNPVSREAAPIEPETIDATHHFWLVNHDDRLQHTADIIASSNRTIVFTRTRHGADRLAKQLGRMGVEAVAMHGGRSQNHRNRALRSFSSGSAQALIATDVAARGIHVDDVETVIHFDPAGDHKDYTHRSGRTGRAGASGTVISLVKADQRRAVMKMQRQLSMRAHVGKPDYSGLDKPSLATELIGSSHETVSSLFVGNLAWTATAADLEDLFSRHGSVTNTSVVTRRGKSKGYGFVEMHEGSAQGAIDSLNGRTLLGRPLEVRRARPVGARG